MDPVAKKSYAPLYFQTQANLAQLEEMAAEYERASKAVSPKAMPTTPTTTDKAPVVDLEDSAAQPPEAKPPQPLPSSGSGARLGEICQFFFYCRSRPVDRPCKRKYAPGCGPYNLFLLKLGV